MKKSYMIGVILSLFILTAFVPAEAAQSTRQKASQAWQKAKQKAGKAASFAGRHKGKIATAAVAAAGVAAGAYGAHKHLQKLRDSLPEKGWYLLPDTEISFLGWHHYLIIENTTLLPFPTVTYSIKTAYMDDRSNKIIPPIITVVPSITVPLETFNADYPQLKAIRKNS